MLFNSFEFILFYLILLVLFYTIQPRKRWILILLGSMIFFMYFKVFYLLLILFTILVSYYTSRFIITHPKSKKAVLIAGIIIHLFLLCYYKYFSFMLLISKDFFNFSSSRLDLISSEIILPIGISFFTFQAIGYEIDVFRDEKNYEKNIAKLSLFILFFPQLVAGPIERASNVLPQLKKNLKNRFNYSLILEGFDQILLGFFKKIVVADTLSVYINNTYQNTNSTPSESLVAIILFSFQIYCDFSGYSDIAIGAALILGFKIPRNFNKPYFATSPSDFWNRWHISLSSWLRDYLYIPLGGNKKSHHRTYFNLFAVMFLGGLWHGASWNFVIWGILHGGYLAIHKMILNKFPHMKIHPFFKSRFGKILSILITQYFVFLAWIPFRVSNTEHMLYSIEKYVLFDFQTANILPFLSSNKLPVTLMLLFFLLHFLVYIKPNTLQKIVSLKLRYWTIFLIVIVSSILFFYDGNPSDFIYFRF